jgi:pimeloyl-ACP methyl ester carboxylesterase
LRYAISYQHDDAGQSTSQQSDEVVHTASDAVAAAQAVLDALEVTRAHLVAFGIGVAVARRLADLIEDRVASLTLVDPGVDPASLDPGGLSVGSCAAQPHHLPGAPVLTFSGREGSLVSRSLKHTSGGWREQEERFISRSLGAVDPTGWFERMYAAGAALTSPGQRRNGARDMALGSARRDREAPAAAPFVVECLTGHR